MKCTCSSLACRGFMQAGGVALYVAAVGFMMQNGDRVFGTMKTVLGPAAFLLLFVVSALITGSLVLGQSALWYLDGKKREAVELFLWTAGWLCVITMGALTALAIL